MKFETPDIATAAFLLMRGLKLVSATNKTGKYNFVFEDPQNQALSICLEFINSECSVFDNHMRTLRGILRDSKN